MAKVQVIFTYDEKSCKWEASVVGIEKELEARQAFTAVVMTCQQLNANLQDRALVRTPESDNCIKSEDRREFLISPAV